MTFNPIIKYCIIFISAISSIIYCSILCSGSIIQHFIEFLFGKTKFKPIDYETKDHSYIPRKAFEDLENMKPSANLEYYIQHLNLELEEYKVTTIDGFILTLHRIINPKEDKGAQFNRKPVLLQHGLLSCSGTFIASGQNSLGFYLFEQGFDVWLGNNRSWFKAEHQTLKNLYNNEEYWNWSVPQLAYFDLPSIIETILSINKTHKKLILIGHSQGGLQSFLMLKNPEFSHIHEKIELFIPIAPAIYPGSLFYKRYFLIIICHFNKLAWILVFGICAMLRNLCLMRNSLCEWKPFGYLSYYMFKYLFGWTCRNWGSSSKVHHFLFIFNMSYVSVELMKYYLGKFKPEGFVKMLHLKSDYKTGDNYAINPKNPIDDSNSYFPYKKSWFDHLNVPVLVVIGEEDYLVDGKKLVTHMTNYEHNYKQNVNLFIVEVATYNHLDVVWAEDLIGTIGFKTMKVYEQLQAQDKQETEVVDEKTQSIIEEDTAKNSNDTELNEKPTPLPIDIPKDENNNQSVLVY
ncbi:unnamed protein product [Candida verbasci]|uniref:Partial AB-hydrolase lipase domain-containing protein n=1 Tax=Candida verbasci TaxID=1227364 RepID=A0A9W4XD65_9ASCO|nr:unnamed protein product [Candida verbasci]